MLPFYSLEKFLPFPKGLHTRSLCSPLLQAFLSQPPQAGCVACVGAISISQCQAATHNTSCFISAPTPPTLLGKKPPTTSWCDGRGDRWGGGGTDGSLACWLASRAICHPLPGEGQGFGSCVSRQVCKGFAPLPCCRDVNSADMEGSL